MEISSNTHEHHESLPQYRRFKMEAGDNKEIELGKDRKSYAGIPEADFVVSMIY